MKSPQLTRLCKLLTRRRGCTAMEIIEGCKTTAPQRRIADLKETYGWEVYGKRMGQDKHLTYFGIPPAEFS